jgi:hypothetical protein
VSRRSLFRCAGYASGALAAPGLLAGCAAGPGPVGASAAEAGPKALHLLYATVEGDLEAVRTVLPALRERFGIELVIDGQPYDALRQKTFAELAVRSDLYDIMIMDTPWTPALTKVIEPLSGYLRDPALGDMAQVDLADFIPKIFYDTAVYREDAPLAHFPDETAPPSVDGITRAGFDVYGLPIVREPSVFLMDEPLSNLDAKLRVETRANIAALQQRLGTTTIYVTHDQVEAMTMGHRVRGAQGRRAAAVRHAQCALRATSQRLSGRLHRLARDEPGYGARHRRRCRAGRAERAGTGKRGCAGHRGGASRVTAAGSGGRGGHRPDRRTRGGARRGRLCVRHCALGEDDRRFVVRVDGRTPPSLGQSVRGTLRDAGNYTFSIPKRVTESISEPRMIGTPGMYSAIVEEWRRRSFFSWTRSVEW